MVHSVIMMKENKYNTQIYVSNNFPLEPTRYYSELKTLEFVPSKLRREVKPIIKKGEKYPWRLLGLIPVMWKTAKRDIYEYKCSNVRHRTTDILDVLTYEYGFGYKLVEGNKIYEKPYVRFNLHSGERATRWFDTDEEAQKYVNYTKQKCCEYHNMLTQQ